MVNIVIVPAEVYPRVGGGYLKGITQASEEMGLSPRGRGIRFYDTPGMKTSRSIPAWAGDTLARRLRQ